MTDITSDAASVTVSRQPLSSSANNDSDNKSRFVISKCRRNANTTPLENNQENQETSEDSEIEERLLAVYCRSGKLGAASYTLQTGELMVLEEIVDRPPDFQMFGNLYRQVQPAKVLLEGKSQGAFVVKVKQTVFDSDSSGRGNCKLVFVSAREYSFEACKRRIYSLSLPNEPPNCTESERTMFIRTVVNFSQIQSIHALGAVLRYLDLNGSSLSMELHSKPQFLSITKISLKEADDFKIFYEDEFLIWLRHRREDIVTMDEDTYRGLQIFSSVSHPSNFKKGVQGSNKEGLSLFQLFSKCSSKVGQSRMRIFLQHPTRDLNILKRRQDVVAFFMRPQHEPLMRNICSSLRFIKNVNGILAKIKALSAKPYQWKSLYNTLYNTVLICEMCEGARNTSEFLEELASCDNNKLYEMALYMNRIIDFDLSKSEGKFTVKAGVDPELDRKKLTMACLHGLMSETAKIVLERLPVVIQECTMMYMPHLGYLLGVKAWVHNLTTTFINHLDKTQKLTMASLHGLMSETAKIELERLPGFIQECTMLYMPLLEKLTMASLHGLMSETAKIELERLPAFIQECTMLYMPHLGYLLGVKAWADNLTPQQKELPDMKFMFQNNDYIHFKSKGCEELDVMIGDAYPEIVAHETRIMMRLTGIVLEHLHTLAAVIDKCAELDCLIAISKVCKEHNFVRPTLTTDKVISIKQGRHPLYAMICESFVANDAECSQEAGLVKILTGPNSSGKSVYMKQIGLIVYLAHIGSFVPAEAATIGVVSHIHSRIQSTECIAAHMSAFLIDLRQMALALQESTSNSLVIIDEFGKGTSEVDGLSLLAACLNTLLFQRELCPHVLLSTHFLNLKEYIVDTPIVRFLRFDHMLQDGEPVFLFQVTEGSADSSFAHHVAAASGIEPRVVGRAREVMAAMMNNSLPAENKKITAKLRTFTEAIKNELLAEDFNS